MTNATLEIPAVKDKRILELEADREAAEAREKQILEVELPSATYRVEREPHTRPELDALHTELRAIGARKTDDARAIYHAVNERRTEVGRTVAKSREYADAVRAALEERAKGLVAQAALMAVHRTIAQEGVPVPCGLPLPVVGDLDGCERWARELVRVGILDAKQITVPWLRERLGAE